MNKIDTIFNNFNDNNKEKYRPVLLACEAIGWLHMTGKAHPDFLRNKSKSKTQGDSVKYKEFGWLNSFPLDKKLKWLRNFDQSLKSYWPNSFKKFITKHRHKNDKILALFQAAHAMASGIEKQSYPESQTEYPKQEINHMWLTSPFGYPICDLLSNPPTVLQSGSWTVLINQIKQLLDELERLANSAVSNLDSWWKWRESAIGRTGWLRNYFMETIADTRLPNNDVTLWDQSYVAAALFKSAIAGAILLKEYFNWNPDDHLKQNTQWRVLTVGFGTQHYEARSIKIGDWIGAKQNIDNFFEDIRRLIEVDFAIGSLVYKDDETLAFTFPEFQFKNDKNRDLSNKTARLFCNEIEKKINAIAEGYKFETPPLCQYSDPTRSFIPMIAELRNARRILTIPIHRQWKFSNPEAGTTTDNLKIVRHVCPVCLVRLNKPSLNDQTDNACKSRLCSVCDNRRKGRLSSWLQGKENTIWISEVADENDRVALLSFSLAIEPWIEGEYADSLRAQSISELLGSNLDKNMILKKINNKQLPINSSIPYNLILYYVFQALEDSKNNNYKITSQDLEVLEKLHQAFKQEKDWKNIYNKIVEDRSNSPKWKDINNNFTRAKWIVHQLFRKLPSPGRIYRFWRTVETFFDDLFNQFCEKCIELERKNKWRTHRLILYPDSISQNQNWVDKEKYITRFFDAPFELLYIKEGQKFITVCNLARCLQAWQDKDEIKGKEFKLYSEEGQGTNQLKIINTDLHELLGKYKTIIVLDKSPVRFRVLVPLNCATKCIEVAIEKWKKEFSRVWDRMPIHIGVVGFPRLMPFQAVIETTRNLEASLTESRSNERWCVRERYPNNGNITIGFEREDGAYDQITIPITLSDGRDDVFYPYVRVENTVILYERDFQHPDGQIFRHVKDLQIGDWIIVNPARIGTVFLDTTSRRFEKPIMRYLSDFERMQEIWQLLCESAPSQTSLHDAWSELVRQKANWLDPAGNWFSGAEEQWKELARAVFSTKFQLSGKQLDDLVKGACNGIFEWAIEWHLFWLKETIGETS
ncbi:CRISPR-associated protein Csx11 [Methylacidiphilum caldifontis]|uniref:CRISPR-associated protein Csx11 n=1 Tax=Methylacidiphilum caldifontis TaxID=2795386 RepID=A0A4Y8PAN8_9BACT|nr:CRISPR-associated protein Csx11 [Methylacidiphilum caldifontis]TFE67820.1 CRISPR-associated protein Csx11 [Methylacidiphilum caldifontis]